MADRGAPPRPDRALIFSRGDGTAEGLSSRPSAFGGRRYRYRYEVSTADNRLEWQDQLASSTAGYAFLATLEVTWRVTDPVEIVRRGLAETRAGDLIARREMVKMLTVVSRQFDIKDHSEAQQELTTRFGSSQRTVPDGLTIDGFAVKLQLDDAALRYLRERTGIAWNEDLAVAQHDPALKGVERVGQIQARTEGIDRKLLDARAQALLAASRGEGGLLLQVMAQDPSQLHNILREMDARRDIAMDLKLKLFQEMVANKLIQPADIQDIWENYFKAQGEFGAGPTAAALPGPDWSTTRTAPPQPGPPQPATVIAAPLAPGDPGEDPGQDGASPDASGTAPREPEAGRPRQADNAGVVGWKPVGRRRGPGTDDKVGG